MGNLLAGNLLLKILTNHDYVDWNLACCHSAVMGQLKVRHLANQWPNRSILLRTGFNSYSKVCPVHSVSTSVFIPLDDKHTIRHSVNVLKYLIDAVKWDAGKIWLRSKQCYIWNSHWQTSLNLARIKYFLWSALNQKYNRRNVQKEGLQSHFRTFSNHLYALQQVGTREDCLVSRAGLALSWWCVSQVPSVSMGTGARMCPSGNSPSDAIPESTWKALRVQQPGGAPRRSNLGRTVSQCLQGAQSPVLHLTIWSEMLPSAAVFPMAGGSKH